MNVDEVIDQRLKARQDGNYKKSDELRNLLDSELVFVFDHKEGKQEVFYLTDGYFKRKERLEETRKMTNRKYVEYRIQQERKFDNILQGWLTSVRASN